MSWSTQLDTASFRGVELQVESVAGSPSLRRLVEHTYPGRDGADLDDLGRAPRRYHLTAVFVGASYESELGAFLAVVDAGRSGQFIHPTLGTFTARVSIEDLQQTPDRRDAAMVTIRVVEDGTGTQLPDLFSLEALEDEIVDITAEVAAANTAGLAEPTDAITQAKEFAARAQSSVASAVSEINRVRSKIDKALRAARALTDFENYALVKSLRKLAYSCQRMATVAQQFRPKVIAEEAKAALPLPLLAQKLYGDRDRADRIAELNPSVRNPFNVPAGTRLKVHSS